MVKTSQRPRGSSGQPRELRHVSASAEGWLAGEQLWSWKEIAAYLQKDIRTVQRWERLRGLPVHRLPGGHRRAIYSLKSELDKWARDTPGLFESRPRFLNRWPILGLVILVVLTFVTVLIFLLER